MNQLEQAAKILKEFVDSTWRCQNCDRPATREDCNLLLVCDKFDEHGCLAEPLEDIKTAKQIRDAIKFLIEYNRDECPFVLRAFTFAGKAHRDQMYGEQPYIAHLKGVVSVLESYEVIDENLIAAGYLHDTVEDTDTKIQEIYDQFGKRVGDIVDAVTDGDGKNRKEKKERPYRLIPAVPGALTIKLADRISNVTAVVKEGKSDLLNMYRKENAVFYDRLFPNASKLEQEMFNHINELLR